MKIKEMLKSNKLFVKLFERINRRYIAFLSTNNPRKATEYLYRTTMGKSLNLDNPKDFNEKLQWLKLYKYYNNEDITICVDKLNMHNYLAKLGLEEYCVPIIGCWEKAEDISWDQLPEKYVLKCNHGCGYNIVCTDTASFDRADAIKKLNEWRKEKFWTKYAEFQYRNVKPMILCEKYIDSFANSLPVDYKIHCFNGEPVFTLICSERESQMKACCVNNLYEVLDYIPENNRHYGGKLPEKPKEFDKMLDVAKTISANFPFVRVDLYSSGNNIFIGELTFLPQGGLIKYYKQNVLTDLGNLLNL